MMKKKPSTAAEKTPEPEHPKSALMSRLSHGTRGDIDKKDMLKLTNKNF
jgi:hypothetical protein